MDSFALINRYHVQMLGYFLEKLRTTPDGDGNLLDHSVVLYGSSMSNGNQHDHDPLPIVVAGGASGQLKGDRHLAFPAHTPINFKVTSDAVMNSFFIPALGGQIYAMAGMQTKLHLIANQNAEMDGISANYSGAGFTGMKFKAIATSQEDFDAWVSEVKKAPKQLEQAEYAALSKQSQNNPVELYSSVTPNLFQIIVDKYEGMKPGPKVKHEKKEKEVAATQGMDMNSHSAAGAEE